MTIYISRSLKWFQSHWRHFSSHCHQCMCQYTQNRPIPFYVHLLRNARHKNRRGPVGLLALTPKFTSKSPPFAKMCKSQMQNKQTTILFQNKDSIMLNCVKSIHVNDAKSVTAEEIRLLFSIMISLCNHPACCCRRRKREGEGEQELPIYFCLINTNKLLMSINWS